MEDENARLKAELSSLQEELGRMRADLSFCVKALDDIAVPEVVSVCPDCCIDDNLEGSGVIEWNTKESEDVPDSGVFDGWGELEIGDRYWTTTEKYLAIRKRAREALSSTPQPDAVRAYAPRALPAGPDQGFKRGLEVTGTLPPLRAALQNLQSAAVSVLETAPDSSLWGAALDELEKAEAQAREVLATPHPSGPTQSGGEDSGVTAQANGLSPTSQVGSVDAARLSELAKHQAALIVALWEQRAQLHSSLAEIYDIVGDRLDVKEDSEIEAYCDRARGLIANIDPQVPSSPGASPIDKGDSGVDAAGPRDTSAIGSADEGGG